MVNGINAEALSQRGIFRKDAPANHDAGSGARARFKEAIMRFYQQPHRFYDIDSILLRELILVLFVLALHLPATWQVSFSNIEVGTTVRAILHSSALGGGKGSRLATVLAG